MREVCCLSPSGRDEDEDEDEDDDDVPAKQNTHTLLPRPLQSKVSLAAAQTDNNSLVSNRAEKLHSSNHSTGGAKLQGSASVSEAPHDKTQVSVKKQGE
ncbi:hypothetical protein PAMP_015652 [Pampus punctatissimus]